MAYSGITSFITETLTGAACTTDVTTAVNAPKGSTGVEVTGSNADYWNFSPRLQDAWWDNNGVFACFASALSERGATNSMEFDSFDAQDDNLYLGACTPFRGFYVNMGNVNTNNATMTVNYWAACVCGVPNWADTCATDGTFASCADTFGQDGAVTFTTPTDWTTNSINGGPPRYHVQIAVSADLDADVVVNEIIPLGVQTTGPVPQAITTGGPPPRYFFDPQNVGGVYTVIDASDTLTINWIVTGNTKALVAGI
jgi:hypothetical protein